MGDLIKVLSGQKQTLKFRNKYKYSRFFVKDVSHKHLLSNKNYLTISDNAFKAPGFTAVTEVSAE